MKKIVKLLHPVGIKRKIDMFCVNKEVEDNLLVGGVPARTIRVLDDDTEN